MILLHLRIKLPFLENSLFLTIFSIQLQNIFYKMLFSLVYNHLWISLSLVFRFESSIQTSKLSKLLYFVWLCSMFANMSTFCACSSLWLPLTPVCVMLGMYLILKTACSSHHLPRTVQNKAWRHMFLGSHYNNTLCWFSPWNFCICFSKISSPTDLLP